MPVAEMNSVQTFNHDVFVSYSTKDDSFAREIVQILEKAGIRCWISYRDILPTDNWAAAIEQAIRHSRAMVLIVSPDFNSSVQTSKEIILGIDQRLRILPIRTVDFQPWGHLRYFLADIQWIDASAEKQTDCLGRIAQVLRVLLAPKASVEQSDGQAYAQDGILQPAKNLGIFPLGPFLKLEMPLPIRLRSEQPSLWLQAYNALVPMSGRQTELEELSHMLQEEGPFRWRVFFGEAGMGKTRLAIEFARQAMSDGWHAGFLSSNNLRLFVHADLAGAWRPAVPTLILVDYAAAKVNDLCSLFEHLSAIEAETLQDPTTQARPVPVRVLLLERHADENRGWLQQLLAAGESITGDLLRKICYLGIRKLQPPGGKGNDGNSATELTRRIIQDTFSSWSAITGRDAPALPNFTEKDWRSIQLRTGNRPLYLQMAALHACERRSAAQLPTWGRGVLLHSAVERERKYIQKECGANTEMCTAIEQVTAILCLAGGGASRGRQWIQAVAERLQSIGITSISPNLVERHRANLFTETQTGFSDVGTGIIQPDIVSEGFAAQVLYAQEGGPPSESLKQVLCLSGVKAWANLIRMVQDLSGIEKHLLPEVEMGSIHLWLLPLLADRPVEELRIVMNLIPERSISLHRFALALNEHLLNRVPLDHVAERAESLLSLATHRCRTPQTTTESIEQAIVELKESIRLFRQLDLDNESCGCRLKLAKAYRMLDNACSLNSNYREAVHNSAIAAHLASGGTPDCWESQAPEDLIDAAAFQIPTSLELMMEFANSLNNLAMNLNALNRRPEALSIGTCAVEVGERLIAHDWLRFAPDLARYLNNLSQAQSSSGDMPGAIANSRRSAEIRAEFARENPDEFAYPLSLTLANLVAYEYAEKNLPGAQLAIELLIAVYDELSARDPGSYRAQLAQCYHNIGYLCDDTGSKAEAVRYTLEGLKIREELLESEFDTYALALAWSHNNVGNMCGDIGEHAKARPHLERAYALRLQWTQNTPGRQLKELTNSASLMAKHCHTVNDLEGEAVWLERVIRHSENADLPLDERGMKSHNLAEALGRLGRTSEAGKAASAAAQAFRREFEGVSPTADLLAWANAGCNLSSALAMQGDWSVDREALTEGMEFCQKVLGQIEPSDAGFGFVWGALMNNLGHAQFRMGEILGDVGQVRQGLATLNASEEHHLKLGNQAAASETHSLTMRAQEVLQKMEQSRPAAEM